MEKMSTKDKILDAALNLFSEKGYDGVGVDLIAEKAGLKGPSLYKHFKGKEAILNALMECTDGYYSQNFGSESEPGDIPGSMEELTELSLKRIRFTMTDPTIRKVRRILAMEQFRNERIAEQATRHSIDGIQHMYQKILQAMMDQGTVRRGDAAMLAVAYTAPISLLIQMCDREPGREEEIMERMRMYMGHFAEVYGVKRTSGESGRY